MRSLGAEGSGACAAPRERACTLPPGRACAPRGTTDLRRLFLRRGDCDQRGRRALVDRVALLLGLDHRTEADALVADAALDHAVEVCERAAADEQHVGRVDREELLVGMLASTLRWHGGGRSLEDLEQRLLDTLAGYVPG